MKHIVPVLLAALALGVSARAQTITVTTLDDVVDFAGPQTVADLPGPDGRVSLREATMAANKTPGPQTIGFAVPTSEFWLFPGVGMFRLENGPFFLTDPGTTIDFSTQTAAIGDTNPAGPELGIYGLEPNAWGVAAIYLTGTDCTIKGLGSVQQRGYAVQITGTNNRVIGCTISGPLYAAVYISGGFGGPAATGNTVGGTLPGEGNWLSAGNSGVRIDGPAAGNIVIGNFLTGPYAGVEIRSATSVPGMIADGNLIGGPTPAERNVIAGAGRIGQEGFPNGAQVSLSWAVNTLIEGNYIGTLADGSAAYPNQRGPVGVAVADSTGTVIRGNLISGIAVDGTNHAAGQRFGIGVAVTGASAGTRVEANRIGTDASGQAPVPNRAGVLVAPTLATSVPGATAIGGNEPGQGNTIAFNETSGISVGSSVSGVVISANQIHSNGGLGIDLLDAAGGGVNPNDAGDADAGGNNLQNFPVLGSATTTGATLVVEGSLDTAASASYRVEFFAGPSCDPSGYGEGAVFLGARSVTSDAAGHADIVATLAAAVAPGASITATATSMASGDTSEFSACIIAAPGVPTCRPDVDGNGAVEPADVALFVNRWFADLQAGTLAADWDANGRVEPADIASFIQSWLSGC